MQLILAAMRNCAADHGVQACACGALANLVQTGPSLPPHCRAAAGVAQGLTVSECAHVCVCTLPWLPQTPRGRLRRPSVA